MLFPLIFSLLISPHYSFTARTNEILVRTKNTELCALSRRAALNSGLGAVFSIVATPTNALATDRKELKSSTSVNSAKRKGLKYSTLVNSAKRKELKSSASVNSVNNSPEGFHIGMNSVFVAAGYGTLAVPLLFDDGDENPCTSITNNNAGNSQRETPLTIERTMKRNDPPFV